MIGGFVCIACVTVAECKTRVGLDKTRKEGPNAFCIVHNASVYHFRVMVPLFVQKIKPLCVAFNYSLGFSTTIKKINSFYCNQILSSL